MDIVLLTAQHRTSQSGILGTARALREDRVCSAGVPVLGRDGAGMAAYEIQQRIGWGDQWRGQLAIITPTGPDASPWVDDVVRFTANDKAGGKLKPYPFRWEESENARTDKLVAEILEPFADSEMAALAAMRTAAEEQPLGSLQRRCFDRALKRARLSGMDEIPISALEEETRILAHSLRWRAGADDRGHFRLAMTVHGAKNREFDYVFVLWPRAVKKGRMRHRRLLYNAVTRARKGAVILVEGADRASEDPLLRRLAGESEMDVEGEQLRIL